MRIPFGNDHELDDVLDASSLVIPADEKSISRESVFNLYASDDDNICGEGALPGDLKVAGCSGESEAEVYLDPIGSAGLDSPIKVVLIE